MMVTKESQILKNKQGEKVQHYHKLGHLENFIFCTSAFLLGVILCYNFKWFAFFALPIFLFRKTHFIFFLLGVLACFIRLQNLNIAEPENMEAENLSGKVLRTYFKKGGLRAVVEEEDFKVIASFKNEEDVKSGDKIFLEGYFIPLPKKVYPYFYDVENKMKFQGISSYFRVKKFEVSERKKFNILQNSRTYVLSVIEKMEDDRNKSIAIALLLGDKGKILKEDYNIFKKAGLAHILAISGLHMSIFAGLVFAFFFQVFSFSKISLKYDTKKISGLIGLLCGLFYLLLAGVPISGLRSFIMVFFLFSGYIFYRGAFGIRSLSLALLFILFFWPEEVMFPSFQLSFISVLCLLKCYNFEIKKYGFHFKFLNAIIISITSSFVVSLLTLPFVIHHFGYVHFYGIFSNVIAIPLLATIVMPSAILSVITNSEIVIFVFEFSIALMFLISEFVSELPFSSIHMNYLNGYLLTVFSFGLIFALNFKNIYRIFGITLISGSLLFYAIFTKKPFLVVNQDYAVIKDGKNYISLFYIPEDFLKDVWQEKLNTKFIPFSPSKVKNFTCEDGACFSLKDEKFTLIYDEILELSNCTGGILINMISEKKDFNCHFQKIITLKELKKNGITPFVF